MNFLSKIYVINPKITSFIIALKNIFPVNLSLCLPIQIPLRVSSFTSIHKRLHFKIIISTFGDFASSESTNFIAMGSSRIPTSYLDTILEREKGIDRPEEQRKSMDAKCVSSSHNKAGKRLVQSFVNGLASVGKSEVTFW